MEIPGFVELGMVAAFYDSGEEVNVTYVMVGCCIPEEDTAIVMAVELGGA